MDRFIFGLLGKRKRRKNILCHWHSGAQKDAYAYVYEFVDTILHKPIDFVIKTEYIYFFGDTLLPIHLSWLTENERDMLASAYACKKALFGLISVHNQGCLLAACKLKGTFSIENRRELVRDFCWMGLSNKEVSLVFESVLLHVLQKLKVTRRFTYDPFVHQLHFALQGRKSRSDLICVYPTIKA